MASLAGRATNAVPAPRPGGRPPADEPATSGPGTASTDGDAAVPAPVGRSGPAGSPSAARSTGPTPPPVRPTVVLAGEGHHDLAAALLGGPLPAGSAEGRPAAGSAEGRPAAGSAEGRPAAAYLVLRHGPAAVRAFIPGHRSPRELDGSGPPTRPPRRVAVSTPERLLEYVHLVVAPAAGPAGAVPSDPGVAVLADAVRGADGLVYLVDVAAPTAAVLAELAELAAAAGTLVLVATRPATEADRAALARQVPAVARARWYRVDDVAGLTAELTTGRWLTVGTDLTPSPTPSTSGGAVTAVTDDDESWRRVLSARLAECRVAVGRRFAADVDALVARCGSDPTRLPATLDTELHALSLRATAALDTVARDLVGAVFAAVVTGRLNEADLVRVTTALWRQIDPDDRTLLVTSTAGVAEVTGAADAVSATGLTPPTLLPPVCLAVSGTCHLMWHYRGVPDRAEARRWLEQAAASVRTAVGAVLDARFAVLAEAVEALAADAVDHGVLLA